MQAAVDTRHHLIVAHDVTNIGNDRAQLSGMSEQAREAMGQEALTVLADRGYFDGEEILACEQAGITPLVPKPMTSGAKADGTLRQAGLHLHGRGRRVPLPSRRTADLALQQRRRERDDAAQLLDQRLPDCPIKAQCTPAKVRRITRWEHEGVIDAMQRRLDQRPDAMRVRRQTAEHPFGTIKAWMGATHFLTRTLKRVSTEMSLHVLAYNMKRVIAIQGVGALVAAARA